MKREEHLLMIAVLATVYEQFGIFLDMLKSRGVITKEDAEAFAEIARFDPTRVPRLLELARERYCDMAKALGIQVEIDGEPEEPEPSPPEKNPSSSS